MYNLATNLSLKSALLLLLGQVSGESALAQVVLDCALFGRSTLGEGDGSAEGTGERRVLELGNADTGSATDGSRAGHAGWHLDGDGEIHGLSSRQAANANAGNVLGDCCGLEG